ncbi:hypothetical protein M1349_01660 [Patescibacteria group bacterium]|nr:hypothetical protein [Patescibacteria group bacterium]
MSDNWRKIFIKPRHYEGMSPDRLDEFLMERLPAAVTQHLENGQYSYRPDSDGLYEVRLFQDNTLNNRFAATIIEHEGFIAVREEVHSPEGELIDTIKHDITDSSDFPGRRK